MHHQSQISKKQLLVLSNTYHTAPAILYVLYSIYPHQAWWHMSLALASMRQKLADPYEFSASLGYVVRSQPVRAT